MLSLFGLKLDVFLCLHLCLFQVIHLEDRAAMEVKKKRLTLDLDPPMQRQLKVVAALKGISMRQYCLTAIEKELARDEANGVSGQRSGPSDAERFAALRKEIFGDKMLPGNSVDLIREARETRDAQLKDIM